ncbi:isochorismate synthase MenF [Microbulbifer aggregans]|uniref:isochorismate synthase n=1 Tax=Microbulbifer aggregans TaxID=1769779 RepID=UPI001CFCF741|nr:isochorismate synthase [Microbulbifer aggregans]
MNRVASTHSPINKPESDCPPEFLFMSSHCGIRARGIFERLCLPVRAIAESGEHGRARLRAESEADARSTACEAVFHTRLREAFQRARDAGIANPIAIGAIPFDQSRPAQLSIPRSYEMFSRALEVERDMAASNSVYPAPAHAGVTSNCQRVRQCKSVPEETRFKQAVQQVIANFQLSDIRKAVLSRVLELELDGPLDLDAFFRHLLQQNPAGYHFRLPLVDGSQLIGASPELLLRRRGSEVFSNPLAGSARRLADPEQDRLVSEKLAQSAKDAYEHSLVIEDIRAQLQPLCRTLDVPEGPQLMHTSAMWHLSTPIRGTLADPSLSALQVACRLHPTPALCGFPTREAHKLIQLVEPFERGLFGGIVGWCDGDGNGEWAVAIRCGIFSDNHAQLFAGAGIVEDSDPDSEWQETRAKLQTMLSALGIEPDAQLSQEQSAGTDELPCASLEAHTPHKASRTSRKQSEQKAGVTA